jgi:hypothetical protein
MRWPAYLVTFVCSTNSLLLFPLFFFWELMLPILSWLCLFSSSVCRISFKIFFSAGLVVLYYISFYVSWKVLIPLSILNDKFVAYSILGLKLFTFSARTMSTTFFLLRFLFRNLQLLWWVYLHILFEFSLLQPSIFLPPSLC